MLRRLFKLLAVTSLAICVLSVFLWVRSSWTNDTLTWNSGSSGGTTITSHRHAIHWLSRTPMIGGRYIYGLMLIGNSHDWWVPGDDKAVLHRSSLGVQWAQWYDDEPATPEMPMERLRGRMAIVPLPLIAGLTAVLPVAYFFWRRRTGASPKPFRRRHRKKRIIAMSLCGLVLMIVSFFWVRSLALDLYRVTVTADRRYSIGCLQHLSAFTLESNDNPLAYQTDSKRVWSISVEQYWIPFGTDEREIGECVLPGPARPFPSLHYQRVIVPVKKDNPLFGDRSLFGDGTTEPADSNPPVMMTTRTLIVPYWLVFALAAAYPLKRATGLFRRIRGVSRAKRGLCRTCGYDLRASPARCPECGTVPNLAACPSRNALQQ